ncbi:Aerobic respiration control sensor protein ArcB [Delftia tsuruhatensis]|uniref:hybrid sensor histidine kinase/response regulator n=1 Tax=Delftia tsuruhatensis TaxID=180282 RepID=UPI001E7D76CB|nr:PAS-domain containing protein [Delftia tsuruhatensis]CAB5711626.1 Aerobic respiration control sensor protein ArcB [Delftia tsuruhatensis]CAC9686870.1 Aerobic respiration control sensor protein ArcB [Delftia tsuruhatensis]
MPTSLRRSFRTLSLLFGGMLACMLLAGELAWHHALRGEAESVQRQLTLYAQALGQRIDRYRTLPEVLALDEQLRTALTHPLSPAEVDALNRKLEQANGASQSSTLTLIDRHGTALAASNWREARSNVGVDYSFRPYVQQALAHGSGRFYGIGLTTGVPGYFLSQAILDAQGAVAGLVVIKIALLELEREWLQTPDVVLASDEHGVVFLASQPDWRYRLLTPLTPADQADLAATRQYIDQELHPMRYRIRESLEPGSRLAQLQEPSLPGTTLWQTLHLPGSDWRLHLLHDTQASTVAGRWAAAAAAGGWLALCLLVLFIRQRRRLAALRLRSRLELETVLRQHAQELRTAQDGIVQAARQADTGLSRSLEHLPQGVVVIDADLNLVAWNSRYVELFRFPAELLRIGQPIEDLFRYNARRGLLGPGPIEEAIHRRLQHLRSGSPHLRESTKDDGTVLEIRGNPLPDGGFVTSYADITSYKNAARDLRSLADALEQRIAERTRDLAEAKREAEQANRYKTRFVAAAVHDLLQPLNAARMFSSLLRGHLHDDAGRHVADSIDGALAAQDAILGSLLDISRMESGQLEVRVRDFALGPLLQVMRHNFGILAESRGLRLSGVDTRCVVRSDEALLRRILQNFLSNAIRYTRQGRIVIGCRRQGPHLRIEVHDQGPGIPESLQHEIFEEFRRLDEGHGEDRGAGLGLAIVERLGRLLGHEIGLRSQLGRGSVFWVCVPLGDPAAVPQITTTAPGGDPDQDAPLLGMSAWHVEDDAQTCTAMRALLQRWGCEVPLAGGPAEALALAAPGQAPQLVLLDVRLGQLHGPDVYAQLCQRWGQSPPVILVTAERDGTLRRQAAERGWGFLAKPVRPPALRALMSQMLLRHRDKGG